LKQKLSTLKNVPAENIFVGNGSDEAIDLLIRAFCNPVLTIFSSFRQPMACMKWLQK
jgi:histidinol-phosphate/aromatic aminotransferase/cobyric acid decarboxylase-like protein